MTVESTNLFRTLTENGFRQGAPVGMVARSYEPADPPNGSTVMWMDASGDVYVKTNVGGTVRQNVLSQYSAGSSSSNTYERWQIIGASGVSSATLTGTTTETALATVVVPGGAMGANGLLRITTLSSCSSSANNKTIRARIGGTSPTTGASVLSVANTTGIAHMNQKVVWNRNSQSSQVGMTAAVTNAFASNTGAVPTYSIDTSVDFNLMITGTLADIADSMALESYLVELCYQA